MREPRVARALAAQQLDAGACRGERRAQLVGEEGEVCISSATARSSACRVSRSAENDDTPAVLVTFVHVAHPLESRDDETCRSPHLRH